MPEKIKISSSELRALLADEATADETLKRYYNAKDDDPFNVGLVLKPEYEIVYAPGEPQLEAFGGTAVDLANGFIRWRRKRKYDRMKSQFPDRPRLVAEGDSWFQHPLVTETIDHLTDAHGYLVRSLDAAGATLEDMVEEDEYLEKLLDEKARALLLSGGGNDLMGGRFGEWLQAYTPGPPGQNVARLIKSSALDPAIATLKSLYEGILTKVKNEAPGKLVFVHTYDHVRPRADGKWLGKPMIEKGITHALDMDAIIVELIGRFTRMLESVAQQFPGVAVVVRNVGVVPAGQWYDEIHPSDLGFVPVARRFKDALVANGLSV